ncbi:MAG: hypothetical protein KC635_15590 [Myxococcales bacterium]|nr:hypothetical protein [Myxococcales bacterium]
MQEPRWEIVQEGLPGALLSVWGTSASDVWAVGADARDGSGPLVLHYDGTDWARVPTGRPAGTLWWVFGFEGGPVYMGGDGGTILRYEGGAFTAMTTPGVGTVFGIWGASADDLWAVGGSSGASDGFAWRLEGGAWAPLASLSTVLPEDAALWKVFGLAADDVWLVGTGGVALHWDGSALSSAATGVGSSLFTVHGYDGHYAAVGGAGTGIIVELDGAGWHQASIDSTLVSGLTGVVLGPDDSGVAVGNYSAVYVRTRSGWAPEETGFGLAGNLHAVWVDPDGGIWAVGGQTFVPPQTDGVLIHRTPPEG